MPNTGTHPLTPKAQLLDLKLREVRGYGLEHAIRVARAGGATWRSLAAELAEVTGVRVADMSLIRWSEDYGWGEAA